MEGSTSCLWAANFPFNPVDLWERYEKISHRSMEKFKADKKAILNDMKKKSKKLMAVLNKNGNMIYAASYKVETAALTNIISDMERKHLEDLEALGAIVWYNLLKEAQADFENEVHDVSSKKAESSKVASATKNRADLVGALNKLFMFLPLQYEMTQAPELGDLIGQLQAEADRF